MEDLNDSLAGDAAITVVASLEAPYPADVLLFHQHDPHVFLVGTYLLDEKTRRRHGRICIYHLAQIRNVASVSKNATLVQEMECDAVLDMKWLGDNLHVAHSTGSLSIYRCSGTGLSTNFILVSHNTVLDPEVLVMSLSVSDKGILTSHSDGSLALWTHELQPVSLWQVSELEAWMQAFDTQIGGIVYSGSDDGVLAAWDTRMTGAGEPTCTFTNRRSHGAGVTAILPHRSANQLITGSYDDKIRSFDLRRPNRAVVEENLGGGVWRVIPRIGGQLAVCCMYNGAKIVEEDSFAVVKSFGEHESMVYGGDVSSDLVGTCSFYDKKLRIWC